MNYETPKGTRRPAEMPSHVDAINTINGTRVSPSAPTKKNFFGIVVILLIIVLVTIATRPQLAAPSGNAEPVPAAPDSSEDTDGGRR